MTILELLNRDLGTCSLLIQYRAKRGEETMRLVTPIAIIKGKRHNRDMVIVWCHLRDALRTLFVDSIRHVDPCERQPLNARRLAVEVARLQPAVREVLAWG